MKLTITTLLGLIASAALTNATIMGYMVPSHIKPGDTIQAYIISPESTVKSNDIAYAFGAVKGQDTGSLDGKVGRLCASEYLGPMYSNRPANWYQAVHVPANIPKGPGLLTMSLMSLEDPPSNVATLHNFAAKVTFGDATSNDRVSSQKV